MELRPRSSLLSQALFYVFRNYLYGNEVGTQTAFVHIYNPTFQHEVRDPMIAQHLTVVFAARGFHNLSPLALRNIAPSDTRVRYVVDGGEQL